MRTNAMAATIELAVETVSKEKFKGNVVFRERPHDLSKFVRNFTLKTKDKNKPGAFIDPQGRRQPKAHKEVYEAVAEQIFRLEPSDHIYVDFNDRRLYNDNYKKYATELAKAQQKEVADVIKEASTKKKSSFPAIASRSGKVKAVQQSKEVAEFLKSLKVVMENQELLKDPSVMRALGK